MIIQLEKEEIAILSLHMQMSRTNVKRGFKSNYGSKEGKEVLASYDEVKYALNEKLNLDDTGQDIEGPQILHFNIKEIRMMDSFLTWYLKELAALDKALGEKKISQEDQYHIELLKTVKDKVDELQAAYA